MHLRKRRRFGADAAGDDGHDKLREALAELRIYSDDIEKVIAKLKAGKGASDYAPSDLGSAESAPEALGGSGGGGEEAGGGSTRSYAPIDSNTSMRSAGEAEDEDGDTSIEGIIELLADKLSPQQLEAIKSALGDVTGEMAVDGRPRFPHENRLGNPPVYAHDGAFFRRYPDIRRIKTDLAPAQPRSHGDNPHARRDMDAWLDKTFPDRHRLKV